MLLRYTIINLSKCSPNIITEPCSLDYGGFYYWAGYIGINKINNVIITGGVVA